MTAAQHSIRVPAEWESHKSIWLAMPHDEVEWGNELAAAQDSVRELVTALLADEEAELVELLVDVLRDSPVHPQAREHLCEYGDIWLRDTGPIFLHANALQQAAAFEFNGWGGKYLIAHDQQVAALIAELSDTELLRHAWVLEGGAVDGNGAGTFLTTRECLLNRNRNGAIDSYTMEEHLRDALGARKVIWLERGLRGDHTDGHIDNLARFVGPKQVVYMRPSDASDPNADILNEAAGALQDARTADGEAIECVELPSPGAIRSPGGLMAASYCNFLITNRSVVVPIFGRPSDTEALSIFSDLFPTRRIVGLDACALLTGGGTVHCISQQEPNPPQGASHSHV